MSTVTFPGLGLTLHLNRVAFSIGTFHVYWYGIIIALGFFFGVAFCCAQAKKFGLNCRTLGKLYERRGLWRPNGPALAHGN